MSRQEPFTYRKRRRGPIRADEVREGDGYEVSNGYSIECSPTGARGSRANLIGGAVLKSDPAVASAGVDTGYSPEPHTLRAPDVAVGPIPDQPGWVDGVPALAVEYADTGQNEDDLTLKIRELLAAGTRIVWVVRLAGQRRVEVHSAAADLQIAYPGDELTAPGILRNPVPVEALYDWQASDEVAFRNYLERRGYKSLDEVRDEGRREARDHLEQTIREILADRQLAIDAELDRALADCTDLEQMRRWLRYSATVAASDELRQHLTASAPRP